MIGGGGGGGDSRSGCREGIIICLKQNTEPTHCKVLCLKDNYLKCDIKMEEFRGLGYLFKYTLLPTYPKLYMNLK